MTEKMLENPYFGGNVRQFRIWYCQKNGALAAEEDVKKWLQGTFPYIFLLPPLDCEVPHIGGKVVQDLNQIPPTRFAGFRTTPPSLN